MCGFAGFIDLASGKHSPDQSLRAMGGALVHRGPDQDGFWYDQITRIGLVHRRLSIQDLSPAGAQPMSSASGRFVIAFNGEIYNFCAVRQELLALGCSFKSHSDTEVMLAAFETWGLDDALAKFSGMFAFALVDRELQKLYLARDRMGEKPLYYGWQGGTFLFGSELKALCRHPSWEGNINQHSLPLLLRHNFISAPHTVYQDVYKLLPSTYICFDVQSTRQDKLPKVKAYWQLRDCFSTDWFGSRVEAADHLEHLLSNVIAEQMISDVPLGAFLSGGIDSSLVVSLMQKQSMQKVKTFSIGFDEPGFNEAIHAKAVAEHLHTEHTELYVKPDDALNVIPLLPTMYDEPFADSSQIPTYLVSQMTKQHVTVALSGDGGDELFSGYTRYFDASNKWRHRNSLSHVCRSMFAKMPASAIAYLLKLSPSHRHRSYEALRNKLQEFAKISDSATLSEHYRASLAYWHNPADILREAQEPPYALTMPIPEQIGSDPIKQLVWRDLNWYLPDDILVKVDRAAMACSLETRVPMLDFRVVEFAMSLPTALNVEGNVGKKVLREVLYRHVPQSLVDRPKQGFAIPIAAWLRTSLRDWAENLLSTERLNAQGYWHSKSVRWYWQEHLSGREDYSFKLWGILMFQAWHDSIQTS